MTHFQGAMMEPAMTQETQPGRDKQAGGQRSFSGKVQLTGYCGYVYFI